MSEYINNSHKRKEALKKLILDLHAGLDLAQARARFAALIGDVSAVEIAQMEQELINEGLPAQEVKALCDVHVAVFQSALDTQAPPEMMPGHPIHTFKAENFALGELLKLMDEAAAAFPEAAAVARLGVFAERLGEVEKVYVRKENLLFPILERHGVTGPSKVMWATHDDIRRQLKALASALGAGAPDQARALYGPLAEAIRQMFYKEEHILYPTALKMLSEEEWVAIRDQSDAIGYCLVRPGDRWRPQAAAQAPEAAPATLAPDAPLPLDVGALTLEQINLLLKNLPVDVTFVDENDKVQFYSEGIKQRIFTRTPAIIGRSVQNCHPPASVAIVNKLVAQFRAGERDSAEFWIQMGPRYVHIRYFALRDGAGRYRGTLEVTQDVAPIRALQGERRLLDETK